MLDIKKAQALLQNFFSDGEKAYFERKSVIIQYDQPIDSTYYIVEGCVKIISHDSKGRERIHYLYGPGDFFPVTWLFGNTTFKIEFVAFSHVTVLRKSLMDTNTAFEREPYGLLAIINQQTSAYDRIINLNMGSATQRVAYRILILCFKFGKKVGNHYLIDLPLTLQELADMVRLTREHAGTVIAELERNGCLIMGRRNIIVYDEQLKKYAEY